MTVFLMVALICGASADTCHYMHPQMPLSFETLEECQAAASMAAQNDAAETCVRGFSI